MLGNIEPWLAKNTPDIVLIHLGTNDVLQQRPLDDVMADMETLITVLRRYNSNIKFFVATLIPVAPSFPDSRIEEFNYCLKQAMPQLSQPVSPLVLVDQFKGFDALNDTYDGVHPNASGEKKMSMKWFMALEAVL